MCRNRKNVLRLRIKELEMELNQIKKREKDLKRRKKELDKEFEGIILTKPALYSEMA